MLGIRRPDMPDIMRIANYEAAADLVSDFTSWVVGLQVHLALIDADPRLAARGVLTLDLERGIAALRVSFGGVVTEVAEGRARVRVLFDRYRFLSLHGDVSSLSVGAQVEVHNIDPYFLMQIPQRFLIDSPTEISTNAP
jgi:hypothetical protein